MYFYLVIKNIYKKYVNFKTIIKLLLSMRFLEKKT